MLGFKRTASTFPAVARDPNAGGALTQDSHSEIVGRRLAKNPNLITIALDTCARFRTTADPWTILTFAENAGDVCPATAHAEATAARFTNNACVAWPGCIRLAGGDPTNTDIYTGSINPNLNVGSASAEAEVAWSVRCVVLCVLMIGHAISPMELGDRASRA